MNSERSKQFLRVVLDTNVYISAFLSPGNSRKILECARENKFRLLVSNSILDEIERILRVKFNRSDWQVNTTLSSYKHISTSVSPDFSLSVIQGDDTDNRIIECAVAGKAEYIISGDHHLLFLNDYQGIRILSPAEFVRLYIE